MDRLFLDANVLFSAAYSADAGLLGLLKLKNVLLCSSRYALEEARINLSEEEQQRRLMHLSAALQLFDVEEPESPRGISLSEKDVPILLAAIEARANYLLTGDIRHFGPYLGKRIEGVMIELPGQYLRTTHRHSG
jgi:predicted nucleic acid-binding protein